MENCNKMVRHWRARKSQSTKKKQTEKVEKAGWGTAQKRKNLPEAIRRQLRKMKKNLRKVQMMSQQRKVLAVTKRPLRCRRRHPAKRAKKTMRGWLRKRANVLQQKKKKSLPRPQKILNLSRMGTTMFQTT